MAALSYTRKSTQITAIDAGPSGDATGLGGTPSSANAQTGAGGPSSGSILAGVAAAFRKTVTGFIAINPNVDLTTTATIYNMVRLRSNSVLRSIRLLVDANLDTSTTTTMAFNVSAAYSDAPNASPPVLDGTTLTNAGNQVTSATDTTGTTSLASGIKFGGGSNTNSLGNDYLLPTVNKLNAAGIATARVQPLWQALGLASDPGGYVDLIMKVSALPTTTSSSTSTGLVMEVEFS